MDKAFQALPAVGGITSMQLELLFGPEAQPVVVVAFPLSMKGKALALADIKVLGTLPPQD
jgi:hypothetical protein